MLSRHPLPPPRPLNPRRQVKDILAKGGDTKQDGQIHSKSFIGILFSFIVFLFLILAECGDTKKDGQIHSKSFRYDFLKSNLYRG